jgi:hypothetical protein
VKERAKELFAGCGLLLFTIYVAAYFIRTEIFKVRSMGENMTFRLFYTQAEMRVAAPMLKVEELLRKPLFWGHVRNGASLPIPDEDDPN